MRILIGIQHLWRGGGTETHTLTLANELQKLGHQASIYTAGGPWITKARSMGVKVFMAEGAERTSNQWRRQLYLKRLLQRQTFDILHAHDATSLYAFTQAVSGMSKHPKVIFTVHGQYVPLSTIFYANNQADAIICVSSNIKKTISKSISSNKVCTINNGIRANEFSSSSGYEFRKRAGIPLNAFVVGYSGRFTLDKGKLGKRIVHILAQFSHDQSNVYTIVAGRGSKKVLSRAKRVLILGHIEQMPSFFNACDVVVGTGRTAMEALFCEVPVIALGKAGYQGPVTSKNIGLMIQNNFGDHGPPTTWTSHAVSRALTQIRAQNKAYSTNAKLIRKIILRRLSATEVTRRILNIYKQT